jgi:small subunit ribosomal protein S4
MIRKKKSYLRPKKAFEKSRIEEENALRTKYGLKNKLEIWKTLAKVNYFRSRAKELAKLPLEEQEVLFNKLKAIGLKTESIADVLDLKVEDLLERRLQTVVLKKKLANTPKQARQMITHKKILVDSKVVNSPGFIVPVAIEKKISIKVKKKKPKPTPKEEKPEAPPAVSPAEAKPEEKKEEPKPEEPKQEEEK